MEKMKIEIWSDIACPYCFIGKRKLEAALQKFPHADEVELVWHSYELNSDLGKGVLNIPYMKYYEGKEVQLKELLELGEAAGIQFNFEKLIITNTSDALRTIQHAGRYNLAAETTEAFFMAYFTQGKCISDREVIRDIAQQVGLPVDEVMQMLDSDAYVDVIINDIRYSEDELNLEYIPFYLFNQKTIIQGSIPSEVYSETLEKAYKDWKINGVSSGFDDAFRGQGCSIDGTGCY